MLGERRQIHVERDKDEAAVGFHARHLRHVVLRLAEIAGIAVRPRHAAQLAGVEEVPAVIRALERARIALVPAAQRRAAMGAAVVERADRAVHIAHDDQRTQAEPAGDEIVVVRNLALVRDVGPGAAEDVGHLRFENRRICVDQAMHAVLLHQLVPVIQRRTADAAGRRADLFEDRHGAVPSLSAVVPAAAAEGRKSRDP